MTSAHASTTESTEIMKRARRRRRFREIV